jgi:Cytochrome P460
LEATIKDSKRFKDEPGNWAYFSFGHKYPLKAEATKQNAAACNACHQTSAVKDYVFSQFYPVLRAAAPHSK